MPFASATYCFPASLPPRPKIGGGGTSSTSRGWNASSSYGGGGPSNGSSGSNSTRKRGKIYSHGNGLVVEGGPGGTSHNLINVRDFNQDKRKGEKSISGCSSGSRVGYFDNGKDTTWSTSSDPSQLKRGGGGLLSGPPPTPISSSRYYSAHSTTNGSNTREDNHKSTKSKIKSGSSTHPNNNSCHHQQPQQQQQMQRGRTKWRSSQGKKDCQKINGDRIDYNGHSQPETDSQDEEKAEEERNRLIHQMLYGSDTGGGGESGLKFDEFERKNNVVIEPSFGFVYGFHGSGNNINSSGSGKTSKKNGSQLLGEKEKEKGGNKYGNRFSCFLGGGGRKTGGDNNNKEERQSLSWLWQKRSLSEGNLYSVRRIGENDDDDDEGYEYGGRKEISYHQPREGNNNNVRGNNYTNSTSSSHIGRDKDSRAGGKEMGMIGMDQDLPNGKQDRLMAKTWQRNSISVNMDTRTRDQLYDDGRGGIVEGMRQKPKFFRSLSLRSLVPIGGMNKTRTAHPSCQGKPVQPPTVPGLLAFSSFRVKKSEQHNSAVTEQQQPSPSSSSSESQEDSSHHHHHNHLHHHLGSNNCNNNKETQRFSGSSLGSAGSSYASSASSSDNRSSIGTDDDGFLPPPCLHSDVHLKDDEGVLYHPASQQIRLLKNSSSVDSFSSASTSSLQHHPLPPDMHQGFYAKVGGISGSSNGGGNTNGTGVVVHVDSHPSCVQHQQQQQQQHHQNQKIHGGSSALNGGPPNSTNTSVSPGNHSGGHNNSHHHPQQHHHQIHHHPLLHHHQQQQHNNAGYPPPPGSALPMANHYQTQISLEDQGIDMTQSPGRESPSSTASSNTGSGSGSGSNGCRHSTASFDSGRASSSIYQQGVRYSGLSSESSSGSFRHSYHSSSSSLGSIAPEEICNFDVAAMINQGIPDHEVLNAWLTGIHFECYYQNFIQAGYDMHTISRMTPEDLNAIGVTKPHHRKRLKSEISQLNISDGLPDYVPVSIEEWLCLLFKNRANSGPMEEYAAKLRAQGYHSVRQVCENITWEDLEDTGILKLGHQKKFMLAIKRIEDILAGKRISASSTPNAYLTPMDSFPRMNRTVPNTLPNHSGQGMYGNQNHSQFHPAYNNSRASGLTGQSHHQQQQQMWRQNSQNSGIYAHAHTLTHQPQLHHVNNSTPPAPQPSSPSPVVTPQYHPDVISIQVNNGRRKSIENVSAEPIYSTSSFLPSQKTVPVSLNNTRSGNNTVKFVEEGDTTPTNECTNSSTLPRLLKNKPISKIMGGGGLSNNVNGSIPEPSIPQSPVMQQYGDGYKSLPSKGKMEHIGRMSKAGLNLYSGSPSGNYAGATNTLGKSNGKSCPPPPPRRGSCSGMESSSNYAATGQQQQHPVLSSFTSASSVVGNNRGSIQPPPPPNLSCDQFSCSRLDFPPPPPDMVSQPTSQGGLSTGLRQTGGTTTANFTSSSSSSTVNNASPNTVKMNAANSTVQYFNSSSSSSNSAPNHSTVRNSPPNVQTSSTKSRDPSPVGSDYSMPDDSDPGVLLSRGVKRNGSDASFKSTGSHSSTESESIPFANDNAGTIKNKPGSRAQQLVSTAMSPQTGAGESNQGAGDVLNDIGNMLADLTDELDAILEQEMSSKR